jgi:hypothetical protein
MQRLRDVREDGERDRERDGVRQLLRRLARADAERRREEERPASGPDERGEGDEQRRGGRRERGRRVGVVDDGVVVAGREDRDARELEVGVLGRASRDALLVVDDVVVSRSASPGEERLAQRRGVVGRRHRRGAGRSRRRRRLALGSRNRKRNDR